MWQVACRQEEIADVGDFCEYLIGDQSILVVRSGADAIRAFHNTCLHRGTRLADGSGRFPEGCIRCRYHAWRYDLDGNLVEVVDREEFDEIPEGVCLDAVRVDRWGGFVWICLSADAPPLLEYLDPLPTLLAPYHLDRFHLRTYLSTVLPANWKVAVDAFNEGYHVQGTHPQLLPWTDDVSLEYEPLGIHAHYGRLPNARRQLRPSPRLGLAEGEYDEGEILEAFIAGLGGLFYKDESTLVEEIRASGADGATMLSHYQTGPAHAARGQGRGGGRSSPTTSSRARTTSSSSPTWSGRSIRGSRSSSASGRTASTRQLHQGHVVPALAPARESHRSAPSAASSPTGRSATGARSPTRTTPTWSTCRSG